MSDFERELGEIKTSLTKKELYLIYENTMDNRQFIDFIKRVEGMKRLESGKCLQSINKVIDAFSIPNIRLEFNFN